ncbi:ankyrin repeat domain-containing protein 31 isoform X4 [Hyperolius riggenbachi]|uniref:ankyrin repeat domain-containing protein 31 isoform X4 n=1 Tax=Hyperolius riggenbachi TaxID=752182 RepID=UPI0035A3B28F
MEDYGLCCLKPPTLSDCDSDETIVDGSLPGSDEEEDDSHLQRLFVNSSVPLSSPTGGIIERNNNVLGQLSPEILPVGRAITGSFLRKVWGTPQEEETSQSILRNWTKHSSLPEMQAISIRDDTVCEPGLCEDAQHLIHSPACEVPANGEGALTPLPSGTGVKQSSHLQYKVHESREQGELQLSDVKMVNEDYEAKSVNEETQLPDVEIRRNTSGCVVAAEPSVYDLLKPLSPLGNETQMGDEISDQAYLLFIEKPRDDSSELTPELVESINSVLRLEVQSGIEQLQCNIVRDPSDKERQTPVWNVSSLDVTLIPNTAPAQEDSDHMTEEGGCKLSLQNSGQVIQEDIPLVASQESQTLLPLSVPGSIRYGLTTSRQCCTADLDHDEQIECLHSKKHSTFIVHDQNDDSSQHSPSILANFNLATGGHCSVRSKTAAGSQCIDEKDLGNIHKRDFLGETKLFRAARKGDLAQVTALIKAGIHVNQQDNAGWTALHEASCKGFCEISLALLEAGADVNRRGLNGTVPIHDAVFGNHFETVRLLLEWGADPYAKDENGENAFDKCCSDKMAELLQSHDHQDTEIGKERVSAETRQQEEVNVKSSPAPDMKRYGTRQQSSMDIITTLQETERKQKRLLTTELHTPEDADKYVEEMRHIQDVLNNVATQQRKERDALAIKYRASVDSFKQGILRDKIANLACRQKSMLQLVHNQRQVAVNIIAYQQMKRSASHHKGKSSSLRYRTASPGKNPKSALLTHNERPGASLPNGSTMATRMPAVCAVPDSESNQFQKTFLSFISSSEISGTREVPVAALASEETGPHSSGLTFDEMPQGTENGLLGTGSCSSFTLTDFNRAVIDHLETDAPGNRSPNSIPACSLLTITENSNRAVNEIIHQASNERQQSTRCQHQEGLYSRKFDRSTADHIVEKGLSMETVTGNSSMEECTSNIHYSQSHGKQQMCVDTERKARMVPWKKLIRMGKLKPGKDVLSFQLQDYSHKVSLLPDGRIRDCSGAVYQDPTQWVKALLGNNISVSWKYVADKITYCGKRLLSFMILEEFAPKETNHPVPENQTSPLPSRHSPIHTALRLKDILLHDKRDFFPSHIMDQIWEEFMNSDRLDL